MTKIGGIDLSMNSPGICTYDTDTEEFHFYFYTSNKKLYWDGNFHGTLYNPKWNNPEERFDAISNWAIDIVKDCELVIIEGYSFGSKGTVFHIGENTGLLKHKLWKLGIPYLTPAPTEIKKFATGHGNAKKVDMEKAFIEQTGIDVRLAIGQSEKQENPSSDIIDAYFLCSWGLYNVLKIG